MMKEINYWKIMGISFILTTILYVITGLLLTVSDPKASESLWISVWGLAIIIMSAYSSRKIKSKKEILYFVSAFLLISFFPVPIIIISVSTFHFIWTLMRVETNKIQ